VLRVVLPLVRESNPLALFRSLAFVRGERFPMCVSEHEIFPSVYHNKQAWVIFALCGISHVLRLTNQSPARRMKI